MDYERPQRDSMLTQGRTDLPIRRESKESRSRDLVMASTSSLPAPAAAATSGASADFTE